MTGYALLNISGNEFTIDYKVVDKPKNYQIIIDNPRVVPYNGRWGNAGIYANFFMGTDITSIVAHLANHRKSPLHEYPNKKCLQN